jgi:hypothetical protein
VKIHIDLEIDDMTCEATLNYTDEGGKPGPERHVLHTNPTLLFGLLLAEVTGLLEGNGINTR